MCVTFVLTISNQFEYALTWKTKSELYYFIKDIQRTNNLSSSTQDNIGTIWMGTYHILEQDYGVDPFENCR